MITKVYEVTCDYCGWAINHYMGNKPTADELKRDGFVVMGGMVFCSEQCRNDWRNQRRRPPSSSAATALVGGGGGCGGLAVGAAPLGRP